MNNWLLRSGSAAVVAIALAACSTAGAQYAPGTGVPGPSDARTPAHPDERQTPAASPPPLPARILAAATVAVAGSAADAGQFGSNDGQVARMVRFGRTIAARRLRSPHLVAPPCNHGVEYTYQSNGEGQVSEFLEYFYDAACTHPFSEFTLNADYTSAGGSGEAQLTTFSYSGSTTSYQMDSLAFANAANGALASITVQKTRDFGASTYSKGFTCLFGTGSAIDCGSAVAYSAPAQPDAASYGAHPLSVVTAPPSPSPSPSASPTSSPTAAPAFGEIAISQTEVGQSASSSVAARSASANPFDAPPSGLQIAIGANGFTGAAGSLLIAAATPPVWTVSYGTQIDALTGTATIGFGGYWWGQGAWHQAAPSDRSRAKPHWITSASIALTDSANGFSSTLTANGRGQLVGSVTQTSNGAAVATISIDCFGTGYIAYPNGTFDVLANWVIVD